MKSATPIYSLLRCLLTLGVVVLTTCCTTRRPPDVGDGGLISGQPCGAPCFLGITPGKTSRNAALQVLRRRGQYEFCQEPQRAVAGELPIDCSSFDVYYSIETDTVTSIAFKPSNVISLQEIVSVHGPPSGVVVIDRNDSVEGNLPDRLFMAVYYDGVQMVINLPVEETKTYAVSPNTEIDSVSYFDPPRYAKLRSVAGPWAGFGAYGPMH